MGGGIIFLHGTSTYGRPGASSHTSRCYGIIAPGPPCCPLLAPIYPPLLTPRPQCTPLILHACLPPTGTDVCISASKYTLHVGHLVYIFRIPWENNRGHPELQLLLQTPASLLPGALRRFVWPPWAASHTIWTTESPAASIDTNTGIHLQSPCRGGCHNCGGGGNLTPPPKNRGPRMGEI